MITPERLGLCGAYNWLDGKAAFEIDETGPNQPVKKGACIDPVRGVWKGIDDFVYANSHKTVSSFSAYSIMDNPMTSCGCFEAICAYVPECNGIMVVNREYQGETPVGMTFSSLAGSVGGGQQTPGFMGCGKIFITSKKFLFAEGGHRRLIWMPKELKELLADDLKKRFTEQNVPDLFDQIADETIATEAHAVREYMEKVHHAALAMEDLGIMVESKTSTTVKTKIAQEEPRKEEPKKEPTVDKAIIPTLEKEIATKNIETSLTSDALKQLKDDIVKEVITELKAFLSGENTEKVVQSLKGKNNREDISTVAVTQKEEKQKEEKSDKQITVPTAAERLRKVASFTIQKDTCEVPVCKVKLGATKKEGGTRGKSYIIGGETCMPFHLWEGEMPNRPRMAMEVFDVVSEKYPLVLKKIYGDLLENPSEMAKVCVEKYGAELISIRLEGTHPEKGNRSPEDTLKVIKAVLQAVDVPLIITGHNHFDKNNEVFKAVAQTFAGENLLLNWVEQDNYRTIAGSALAYGHTLVAQSPIDVNIGKQLNILLTNMDVKPEQIVMDPMTGAMGYGIEYTYSVMERIRLTALNGDKMLAAPMIVTPGQECAKIKELKATQETFPAWGELEKRAALWELTTSVNLLYAGEDLLIMYHPEAAMALKRTISKLMDGKE